MLVGDGGNIVVQVGNEGVFVVDTGTGSRTAKTLAAIRTLSDKPIQFIANTSFLPDRTGGNEALRKAGADLSVRGTFFSLQFRDAGVGATIMAHQNVQNRLNAAKRPAEALPTDTFLEERRRTFHNDDAIELLWQPNAITDGDSLVHFRRADVIVTGNIFTTTQYPFIDVASGGTVDGEIKALNQILERTVFEHQGQGGTLVVPGHGYLSDEHEVVEYRDMVVIVRDRIRALVRSGATLEQVKAARPTADYDTRYGATTGRWTTDMFVEAVFRTVRKLGDGATHDPDSMLTHRRADRRCGRSPCARSRTSHPHRRSPTRRRSSSSSNGSRRPSARDGPIPCTSGARHRAPTARTIRSFSQRSSSTTCTRSATSARSPT